MSTSPARKLLGALGGDGEAEVVFAGEEAVGESPDERRGVEVLDDGDAEFWQGRSVLLTDSASTATCEFESCA